MHSAIEQIEDGSHAGMLFRYRSLSIGNHGRNAGTKKPLAKANNGTKAKSRRSRIGNKQCREQRTQPLSKPFESSREQRQRTVAAGLIGAI